jgi:hypothetical protein
MCTSDGQVGLVKVGRLGVLKDHAKKERYLYFFWKGASDGLY